jgi:hypothetical protein
VLSLDVQRRRKPALSQVVSKTSLRVKFLTTLTKIFIYFMFDSIIGQIVGSATDAEQIHHVLEDLLGEGGERAIRRGSRVSQTRYFRLNPTLGLPEEFPIDVTEPAKLERLKEIAAEYLAEPAQQRKLAEIGNG